MLERTVRRICAVITMANTMIGRKIAGKNSDTGALAEVNTMPGTQPSQTEKIKISSVAETNSGMVIAIIATVETTRSGERSRHSPATMPKKSASGTPVSMAQDASNSVLRSR